jgi:hypothetical protein
MTYQAFSSYNPKNINDAGSMREFKIIIPKSKYITQGDIHFKIDYTNINYDKIENYYNKLQTNCLELFKNYENKNINELKKKQTKLNELIESTIKNIEQEEAAAITRETPLFMFQNIELFVNNISIARRTSYSLEEVIVNGCLYLNQIFPGIKFKYDSEHQITVRFQRAPIQNKCLKFECHYNVADILENIIIGLSTGYKEYLLHPDSINIDILGNVKSFKMVPYVSYRLYKKLENKDYKAEAKRLINECYLKLKFKYYKDGLEINETEFGTMPGSYHIELLNISDIKNLDDFYSINYKIICECLI